MFDVSFFELLLVGIVALLVLGPREMASTMRWLGQAAYRIKRFCADARSDIDLMMYHEDIKEINERIHSSHEEREKKAKTPNEN